MKNSKSKKMKLLVFSLPIVAISIASPIFLTSCSIFDLSIQDPTVNNNQGSDSIGGEGDSNGSGDSSPGNNVNKPSDNNGSNDTTSGSGSSDSSSGNGNNSSNGSDNTTGGEENGNNNQKPITPQSYQASWDWTKTIGISQIIFNKETNIPTITLNNNALYNTGLTKLSKFEDIKKSLSPKSVSSNSLYSVLSQAITNVDKFDVELKLDPNQISFDYSNSMIANTISGEYILKPIKDKNSATENTTLKFIINNFDDSYNGDQDKKLLWDTSAIATALKKGATNGNDLQEITPTDNGAAAVIKLNNNIGLGKVMDSLCSSPKTNLSKDLLKSFIKNSASSQYDFANASVSTWTPSVDGSKVFTRIVIPSKEKDGQEAIMYIVYTGFTIDDGNGSWNRNIKYLGSSNLSSNLWDKQYNEPVFNLSNLNDSSLLGVSKDSTFQNINAAKQTIAYNVAKTYNMRFNNLSLDVSKTTCTKGSFDSSGKFITTLASGNNLSLINNPNVIQLKFLLKPKNSSYASLSSGGIWKAIYFIGYKVS